MAAIQVRFNSEREAWIYYREARRLGWTVSQPYKTEHGQWQITRL